MLEQKEQKMNEIAKMVEILESKDGVQDFYFDEFKSIIEPDFMKKENLDLDDFFDDGNKFTKQ